MTYLIGSTRYDGMYLGAYRVSAVNYITCAQWTDNRGIAAEFSEVERETLKLPSGGCWIQAEPRTISEWVRRPDTPRTMADAVRDWDADPPQPCPREFDIAYEADEQEAKP